MKGSNGANGSLEGRSSLPALTGAAAVWAADLVLPVGAPPIRRGALLTDAGRVAALGPAEELLPCVPKPFRHDFGRAILIPGLVDAHTHLELAGLRLSPAPMADWIVALVRETRAWSSSLFLASAKMGAAGTLAAGVTCVGDVTASGESPTAIADAGLRGVVFHEVLGLDGVQAEEILARKLASLGGAHAYRGVLPGLPGQPAAGLSPHAPYTTSPELYRAVLEACRASGRPAATHLAESPEEARFLREGGGDFARMHSELGSPAERFHPPGCSPVKYLDRAGALDGLRLAVHCNQTSPAEWERLRRAGVRVCLCPGSARFFGHPFADAAGMRRAGLGLCLGTDSRASNPSGSLLAEAAALRNAGFGPEELLRLCTLAGAEALGLAGEGAGQLREGGAADFAVAEPPPGVALSAEALFHPEIRIVCTVTGGEARFAAG
ncbi:MAG: amidohydrolase family protein [Candidatus Tectomicrobia bacterium]|uniref:Amidohydrolase family protein n=1 Tax=Tectimicrobiota bacterium TaxID=2528274 RepID=A0A932I0W6_UNCTE|nr:amidohydrolase family protein [Candidatus Tectomicrobia bacterium]